MEAGGSAPVGYAEAAWKDSILAKQRLEAFLAALGSYGLASMDVDDVDKFLNNCEKAADRAVEYATRAR